MKVSWTIKLFRKIWSLNLQGQSAPFLQLKRSFRQNLATLLGIKIRISFEGILITWVNLIRKRRRKRVCRPLIPSSLKTITATSSAMTWEPRWQTWRAAMYLSNLSVMRINLFASKNAQASCQRQSKIMGNPSPPKRAIYSKLTKLSRSLNTLAISRIISRRHWDR